MLLNLLNKRKIRQAPQEYSESDMCFESRALENNFANFMKIVKFKHNKINVIQSSKMSKKSN